MRIKTSSFILLMAFVLSFLSAIQASHNSVCCVINTIAGTVTSRLPTYSGTVARAHANSRVSDGVAVDLSVTSTSQMRLARIRKITYSTGVITTVAGTGTAGIR